MARLLLDQVRADPSDTEPSPARDPMVRSWYRATLAFMAAIPYIDATHFDRAEELFGDDAVVHLLIGSMREWMASDTVQRAIEEAKRQAQSADPRGWPRITPRFPVGSAGAELGRSRRHLERAVRLDASLTEARVRLGRVLGLAGKHRDAAAELRQAVAAEPEPLLAYYAHLFLGAEEEAVGRLTEAREAYGHAASLYPDAPTPRIALSHLMRQQGNRDQALRLIGEVLAPRSEQSARSDPMRRYHRSAGRHVKTMSREMVRLYLEAAPKSGRHGTDLLP
jgi:tetratricopeptide (TPR) repeat protein